MSIGKRRGLWLVFVLIVACNLPGLAQITDVSLGQDPDTGRIISAIRKDTSLRGLATWFVRDWPLENRFYRPLVTISLAADNALYGGWARGYRMTNWLLAVLTALGVYWWLSWLTLRRSFGAMGAMVFSLRQSGLAPNLTTLWSSAAAAAVLLLLIAAWTGGLSHRRAFAHRPVLRSSAATEGGSGAGYGPRRREAKFIASSWPLALCAALVVWDLEWRSNGVVISWIAARTALLGTFFCVLCLACFVGFIRTQRLGFGLLVFALAAAALASYEQSVMLPLAAAATLIYARPRPVAIASAMGRRRQQARVALIGLGVLVVAVGSYAWLRTWVVGHAASAYHLMQLKTSAVGAVEELCRYSLPPYLLATSAWLRFDVERWWSLLDLQAWWAITMLFLWMVAYLRLFRLAPRAAASLFLMKSIFFLPMAPLHVFGHYYYLPEVAASGLAVALVWPGGVAPPAPSPTPVVGKVEGADGPLHDIGKRSFSA